VIILAPQILLSVLGRVNRLMSKIAQGYLIWLGTAFAIRALAVSCSSPQLGYFARWSLSICGSIVAKQL